MKVFPRLNRVHAQITVEQLEDLLYIATHRKAGLCASRGYGKTALVVVYDSFMARKGFKVAHRAHREYNLAQFWDGFQKLGWRVTKWHVDWGTITIPIGLNEHGRGPRCDIISNDEVGTVVLDRDKAFFRACQDMLSGSPLGKAIYIGTSDPNSIWSEVAPTAKIRGYDPKIMPWVTMQYEAAKRRSPKWYMDQEYHCKATPAGGLVLYNIEVKPHHKDTQRYGIDSNPEAGYFAVGSLHDGNKCYLCEAYMFPTLNSLAQFVLTHQHMPIEVELNGVGSVVKQYLNEHDLAVIGTWVDEDIKCTRVSNVASQTTIVPPTFACPLAEFQPYVANSDDVLAILQKQIWGPDKKIVKFSDAHWFDAYYLSVIQGESDLDIANGAPDEDDMDRAFDELRDQARIRSRM